MANRWYDLSPDEVAKKVETDPISGLTSAEARARIEKNGPNRVFPIPRASFGEYVRRLSVNTLSILLALSCIPAVLFGHTETAIVLIITLALNYIAVAVTYVKAQGVLAKMGQLSLPSAKVMRGGRMMLVRQEDIALGDIICLSAGDIVPCDARLIDDENLVVLEAGITDAKAPIRKDSKYRNIRLIQPHEALNMVYASTIVRSGSGKAIACRMGKDTLVCKSGKNKSAVSYDKLAVFERLKRISFVATLTAIALTFILTIVNMLPSFGKFDALDGLICALSYSSGAMTEFYAIFGYMIVSVGVFGTLGRSGRIGKGALIKNAEKLSDICELDTLIIPPEGAAATGDIALDRIYIDNDEDAWCEKGRGGFDDICARVLSYAVISTGIYGERLASINAAGNNVYTSEEEAIIRSAEDSGLYNRELDEKYALCEHLGKCDYSPFEVTLTKHGDDNVVIARGDAVSILEACNRYRDINGKVRPMNSVIRSRLRTIAIQMSRERGIVSAIAAAKSIYTTLVRLSDTLSDMVFEGFLGFSEPLLPNIEQTVDRCRSAGVNVLLFTSDTSERGLRIANAAGIITDRSEDEVIDMAALSTMTDEELLDSIDHIKVFENMDAACERRVIRLLRKRGHKVGFLGLRFEEITAMREANVAYTQSITLSDKRENNGKKRRSSTKKSENLPLSVSKAGGGAPSGCDALRFVSDVILSVVSKNDTSGGINALVSSLERARAIYFGIYRLMSYLLTVNIARLIILLYSFASGIFILTPVQMLICGMVYDLAAVMIIAFEKPPRDILSSFPVGSSPKKRHGILASLITGMGLGVGGIALAIILLKTGSASAATVCTPIFITLLLSSIVILVEGGNRDKLFSGNLTLSNMLLTVFLSILLMTLFGRIYPTFGALFGIYKMSGAAWCGIPILTVGLSIVLELTKTKIGKKGKKGQKGKDRR